MVLGLYLIDVTLWLCLLEQQASGRRPRLLAGPESFDAADARGCTWISNTDLNSGYFSDNLG